MNNGIRLILLLIVSFAGLYFNIWFVILPAALLYGWTSTGKIGWSTALPFLAVFVLWAVCLYVKDGSFYRSPSELVSVVFGGIPSATVPLIGGVVGGVVAMLGSLAGRLLRPGV